MLCLTRRLNEYVVLKVPGLKEPIRVYVGELEAARVQLVFDAPPEVRIVRGELPLSGRTPPRKEG